jgi:hypothetical protein
LYYNPSNLSPKQNWPCAWRSPVRRQTRLSVAKLQFLQPLTQTELAMCMAVTHTTPDSVPCYLTSIPPNYLPNRTGNVHSGHPSVTVYLQRHVGIRWLSIILVTIKLRPGLFMINHASRVSKLDIAVESESNVPPQFFDEHLGQLDRSCQRTTAFWGTCGLFDNLVYFDCIICDFRRRRRSESWEMNESLLKTQNTVVM